MSFLRNLQHRSCRLRSVFCLQAHSIASSLMTGQAMCQPVQDLPCHPSVLVPPECPEVPPGQYHPSDRDHPLVPVFPEGLVDLAVPYRLWVPVFLEHPVCPVDLRGLTESRLPKPTDTANCPQRRAYR